MSSSKLLIEEPPLVVQPTLAVIVGLNEAIVLQQIHYWIGNIAQSQGRQPPDQRPNYREGRWWTYQSFPNWRRNSFPFFSEGVIKRAVAELESKKVLIVRQLSSDPRNRTNWYTIDYVELNKLIAKYENAQYQAETQTDERCIGSKCTDGSDQNDPFPSVQNDPMLIETPSRDMDERESPPPPAPSFGTQPGTLQNQAAESDEMIESLGKVTGMDPQLNRTKLAKTAARMLKAGYTSQAIRAVFSAGGAWYSQDWRGKKGERPTLASISETIAALTPQAGQIASGDDLERKRSQVTQELKAAREKRALKNSALPSSGGAA